MKKLTHLITLALCLLTLTSCSAGKASNDSYSGESAPQSGDKGAYGSADDAGNVEIGNETTADLSTRKLIRTVDLTVETKAFDALIDDLSARTKALGGFIEQSNIEGRSYDSSDSSRYATITCRIPDEKLDEFLASIGENCNIVNENEQVQDVTLDYVDLESRIKSLEAERDALMTLLENAETTGDILAIQSQLTDVIYRLESATASLRTLDDKVDFSTVCLSVREVEEYTEPVEQTFWEEVSTGFMGSLAAVGSILRTLAIAFIVCLPFIVLFAALALIIFFIVRLILKWDAKKRAKKPAERQDPPNE